MCWITYSPALFIREQITYVRKWNVLFSTFLFNTSESGYLTASEYFVLLKTSARVVQYLLLIISQLLFLAVEYLSGKLFNTSARPRWCCLRCDAGRWSSYKSDRQLSEPHSKVIEEGLSTWPWCDLVGSRKGSHWKASPSSSYTEW